MANNSEKKNYSKQIYFGGEKREKKNIPDPEHAQGTASGGGAVAGHGAPERGGPEREAPRARLAPRAAGRRPPPAFPRTRREGTCVRWGPQRNELRVGAGDRMAPAQDARPETGAAGGGGGAGGPACAQLPPRAHAAPLPPPAPSGCL